MGGNHKLRVSIMFAKMINNRVSGLDKFVSSFSVNITGVLFNLDSFSNEFSGKMLSFG